MGKSMYCDLCRKDVAIEEALKPVSIGEEVILEVCLTCGSQLEQGLKKQMADNEAAVIMAKNAAQAPPQQPEAPKPQPQKPAEPTKPGFKVENTTKDLKTGV